MTDKERLIGKWLGASGCSRRLSKTAGDTVPLMTPVDDPRLKHLQGPNVTRRRAWNAAVGPERATTIIDSSAKYRKANPQLFEDVFHGGNIDRPIPANIRTERQFIDRYRDVFGPRSSQAVAMGKEERAAYAPPSLKSVSGDWTRVPEHIMIKKGEPFRLLMHELFHLDTRGTRPQEWDGALTKFKKGDRLPVTTLINKAQYSHALSPESADAQYVTDRVYPTSGRTQRHEIGSQLGTLRAHLEQRGVDTTDPDALRSAIQNLEQHIDDNDEVRRFYDVIHAPERTPKQKKFMIEALGRLMPGIARNTGGDRGMVENMKMKLLKERIENENRKGLSG